MEKLTAPVSTFACVLFVFLGQPVSTVAGEGTGLRVRGQGTHEEKDKEHVAVDGLVEGAPLGVPDPKVHRQQACEEGQVVRQRPQHVRQVRLWGTAAQLAKLRQDSSGWPLRTASS